MRSNDGGNVGTKILIFLQLGKIKAISLSFKPHSVHMVLKLRARTKEASSNRNLQQPHGNQLPVQFSRSDAHKFVWGGKSGLSLHNCTGRTLTGLVLGMSRA